MGDFDLINFIYGMTAFFVALTVHEASHGIAAYLCGDNTAKYSGRLTLNPLAHIDPVGTVLLPLMGAISGIPIIGWAKPVPVNPANFRDPENDIYWVAFAGPGSNLALAVLAAAFAAFLPLPVMVKTWFVYLIYVNIALMIFNLFPIPPLDGSKMLRSMLPGSLKQIMDSLEPVGFIILLFFLYSGLFRQIFNPLVQLAFNFITQTIMGGI